MKYSYSGENRLETPAKYTYAAFGGGEFLQAYIRDRQEAIAGLGQAYKDLSWEDIPHLLRREFSSSSGQLLSTPLQPDRVDAPASMPVQIIRALSADQTINTTEVLECLVAIQLTSSGEPAVTVWLDRLVQRFEVSKKIYETYPPGFRKGLGDAHQVRLYWLLAIALCLQYHVDEQLKYLSTLLKLTDLLCSLPTEELKAESCSTGLGWVLCAEIAAIRRLADQKGVAIGC